MSGGRPPLPAGPYLVVGLARSGAAVARALRAHGAVLGIDAGTPREAADLDGVELHLGASGAALLDGVGCVVKSPGVPSGVPVVQTARERGVPVLGELEVAWRLLPNSFVAVTGTNGKTTTVELLGAIHRAAGVAVAVAGNVGTPLASLVGALDAEAVVVCEASSFQLEDAEAFAPECAVLLNVTPDHLDRHGSLEAYRAAKMRVFARQGARAVAVVPEGIEPPGEGRLVRFGEAQDAALRVRAGRLEWEGEDLIGVEEILLRGAHNRENAMAAAAAALARAIEPEPVRDALRNFIGVPHRLEEVARRDGVLYVNDSKATNPASARVGIEAFDSGVHVILGGSLKGGCFAELREPVAARARAAYLIGEAAGRLAADLEGTVPLERCGDLDHAVAAAARAAGDGEVVLLSPACASFDQYADFEARGAHFRVLAAGVADRAPPARSRPHGA